ncbi:AraC family transcriptional regulator [Marilutibacter chinensis]|uniref:AraC family transcriptional regulator n=1 Tax=Marilutibacter chinensis TaxID=2912247 RepID=A0ABS9HU24_9GAMM|nr:AraC family transcriptional regulator [Lysobacter chinensis]MCF7222188.1 AraC family transcriptional regulator [Lysobacter chinensis]
MDRLHALLQRFSVSAGMFHSGPLCGINDFPEHADAGQLHLIRRGPVEVWHGGDARDLIEVPSLLLYPRPRAHRLVTDPQHGADMACANVRLGATPDNPVTRALPPVVVMPLDELAGGAGVPELLFEEAFGGLCGHRHVVDRLFEVVLVMVLRRLMDQGRLDEGPLAGLADPQLARALTAMHESPQRAWTLPALAACAGMSRSRFAEAFARTVGQTPAAYLAGYRIALAQDLLRRGRPLGLAAEAVGYGSATALSRAFSQHCGVAPRAWLKSLQGRATGR